MALSSENVTRDEPCARGQIKLSFSTFHEPDPSNPLPAYKRKDRKVYLELNVEQSDLRIIDDEKFHQVGKIIDERMFTKNGGIRHDNLLKHLLRCGECGSRFTSAMCKYGRSYKCTGKMPTKRRPRICFLGADVLMYKLDGLVIQLYIRKFTSYDLHRKAMGKVVELEGEIDSKRALQQSYRDIAQELHENYFAVMKRIIRFAKDDAEAENWIAAERSEYERKCEENSKVIDMLKLVIVHFVDGSERWGTVKKGKYGRSQSGQEKIYTGCFIENDDHLFSYDRETHNITEKITSLVHKTYAFEEFNEIAAIRRAKALLLGPRTLKCSL